MSASIPLHTVDEVHEWLAGLTPGPAPLNPSVLSLEGTYDDEPPEPVDQVHERYDGDRGRGVR